MPTLVLVYSSISYFLTRTFLRLRTKDHTWVLASIYVPCLSLEIGSVVVVFWVVMRALFSLYLPGHPNTPPFLALLGEVIPCWDAMWFSRDYRPRPVSNGDLDMLFPCFPIIREFTCSTLLHRVLLDSVGTRSSMYDRECVGLPESYPSPYCYFPTCPIYLVMIPWVGTTNLRAHFRPNQPFWMSFKTCFLTAN